jgi:putative protease
MNTPKSKGEYLEKISKIERQYFEIENKNIQFQNGDGLCFLNNDGVFTGLNINKIDVSTSSTTGTKLFPNQFNGLSVGTDIYRNFDAAFEKQLKNDSSIRQMNLEISVCETSEHLELSGVLENGLRYSKSIPKSNEQANDSNKNLETIRKQLAKSGGTIFRLHLKSIEKSGISGYYPISVLNQLRRDFLEEILELIDKNYPKSIRKNPIEHPSYPLKTLTYRHNVSNRLAKQFYQKCGVKNIEPAFELNPKPNADLMTTKYCLRHELGLCLKSSPNQALMLTSSNHTYSLHFDCKNCEMRVAKGA